MSHILTVSGSPRQQSRSAKLLDQVAADRLWERSGPVPAVAEKLAWVRRIAKDLGRPMRFGIRLHVISRDTSEVAGAEAQRLLDRLDPETVARVQADLRRSESEGQRRMLDLHHGSSDLVIMAPNLWAGVGRGRGVAGTALVGSHIEVADRIEEYADLGISEFVLSGYPHPEEAYWFGEARCRSCVTADCGAIPTSRRPTAGLRRGPRGGCPFAVA